MDHIEQKFYRNNSMMFPILENFYVKITFVRKVSISESHTQNFKENIFFQCSGCNANMISICSYSGTGRLSLETVSFPMCNSFPEATEAKHEFSGRFLKLDMCAYDQTQQN